MILNAVRSFIAYTCAVSQTGRGKRWEWESWRPVYTGAHFQSTISKRRQLLHVNTHALCAVHERANEYASRIQARRRRRLKPQT